MSRQNLLFLQENITLYFCCEELRQNFPYNFLARPNIFLTNALHFSLRNQLSLRDLICWTQWSLRVPSNSDIPGLWFFKIKADSSIFDSLIIAHYLFFLLNCFYFALIMGILLITELTCVFLHYCKPEIYPSGNAALVKKEKIKPNLRGSEKERKKETRERGANIHHYHCKKVKQQFLSKQLK